MKLIELDNKIPGLKSLKNPIELTPDPPAGLDHKAQAPVLGMDLPKGYKGSGIKAFAVSAKGGAEVVKIGYKSPDGPDDDPYIQYVKFCAGHQSLVNLPKIYNVRMFKKDRKGSVYPYYFYYVNLEPLIPLQNLNWKQKTALILSTTGLEMNPPETDLDPSFADPADRFAVHARPISDTMGAIHDKLRSIIAPFDYVDHGDSIKIIDQQLLRTAEKLRDFKFALDKRMKMQNKRAHVWDLHTGNIMVRPSPYGPQLVITDPFI